MIDSNLLLETFDVVSFMEGNGYPMRYTGGRATYITTCPVCGKKEHCGITMSNKRWGCFRCHRGGNFIYLISAVTHKPVPVVEKMLLGELDLVKHDPTKLPDLVLNRTEVKKEKVKIKLPDGYRFLGDRRIPYLDKRQITQEQVQYYRIGFCEYGYYKDRLIVCDVDDCGDIIYWVARDVTGRVPKSQKCLNPKVTLHGVGSAEIPFNFFLAKKYPVVIITEGVFDALYTGPNAIATYGSSIKLGQRGLLSSCNFEKVILLYDGDVSEEALQEQAKLLATTLPIYICKLPTGDPDEYPKDELFKLLGGAKPYTGFSLDLGDL